MCGSDSNYGRIDADYSRYPGHCKPDAELWRQLDHNVSLLTLYRGTRRTFLDVGCCEGTALRRMASLGWDCHGWDVARQTDFDPFTIGERYVASGRLDCVMCREVIEHCQSPHETFGELVASLKPQGVLQIQTPRPLITDSKIPYQTWHVAIISPLVLRGWADAAGLIVLDSLIYPEGQVWTWQRPG